MMKARVSSLDNAPSLIVADEQGQLFDIPELALCGRQGVSQVIPGEDQWMALPPGSDLFHLPARAPIGVDRETGRSVILEQYAGRRVMAAAAFLAPAHTLFLHPAYETRPGAPKLPLYAYCAVGWRDEQFVVPAVRVDPDIRQDHDQYETEIVEQKARELMQRYPHNRLARHLMNNCVLTYGCPAARNFALGRWEMPLPTSAACNSRCFGCISKQPEGGFIASMNRLDFIPTAEEIAEIAVPHLERAERPVASFGQGCEGEPLTNPNLLEEAVRAIRSATSRGTIHLNTNGSRPDALARLFDAGLDSVRVSINSLNPDGYNRYFQPRGYCFEDVVESLSVARAKRKFASINYLVFPGVTDAERETAALRETLERVQPDMIQWRNLNIDPEEYLKLLRPDPKEHTIGLSNVMKVVQERFPAIRFGYFNPCLSG